MNGKAEQTTRFIISTVAPIFNKNGYYGTSMSDITAATGLTKGAIYGNFKNKEDLAFAAFEFNVDLVVEKIKSELAPIESPLAQLRKLISFYRRYRHYTIDIGGCPIINIGVDANHQNSELLGRVQDVIQKLQYYIEKMIRNAQEAGEIKLEIDAHAESRSFFALIEGSIFMTVTINDDTYIQQMMNLLDKQVDQMTV